MKAGTRPAAAQGVLILARLLVAHHDFTSERVGSRVLQDSRTYHRVTECALDGRGLVLDLIGNERLDLESI